MIAASVTKVLPLKIFKNFFTNMSLVDCFDLFDCEIYLLKYIT